MLGFNMLGFFLQNKIKFIKEISETRLKCLGKTATGKSTTNSTNKQMKRTTKFFYNEIRFEDAKRKDRK